MAASPVHFGASVTRCADHGWNCHWEGISMADQQGQTGVLHAQERNKNTPSGLSTKRMAVLEEAPRSVDCRTKTDDRAGDVSTGIHAVVLHIPPQKNICAPRHASTRFNNCTANRRQKETGATHRRHPTAPTRPHLFSPQTGHPPPSPSAPARPAPPSPWTTESCGSPPPPARAATRGCSRWP